MSLCKIVEVEEVLPIENADAIELVKIPGWQCVTKKGEYKVGDKAIYVPIDTFVLKKHPYFEFLEPKMKELKDHGFGTRIKTIKLRGTLSQGLLVPLIESGYTLDEHLGVIKYVKPLPANTSGQIKGKFPSFIPKTDQERCQNLTKELIGKDTPYYEEAFEVTLKLDGSSITIYKKDDHIGVCSRNYELDPENEDNAFFLGLNNTTIRQALEDCQENVAIQGELMGPGVQSNREKLEKNTIFIFDVYDIDRGRYMWPLERVEFLKRLKLYQYMEPLLVSYHTNRFEHIQEILDLAERPSINHPVAEGVVFKSVVDGFSYKAVSNKYLLKYEE